VTAAARGEARTFGVMFVCFGNLCRSPMAEGLAREAVAADHHTRGRVVVESAGLAAMDGERAAHEAVRTMAARSIDISGHRARTVTREMLRRSDLVLAMEDRHTERLAAMCPDAAVYTLLRLGEAARLVLRSPSAAGRRPAGARLRLGILEDEAARLEREGLWELERRGYDVPDPIGWRAEGYEEVARLMEPPVRDVMAALFGPDTS